MCYPIVFSSVQRYYALRITFYAGHFTKKHQVQLTQFFLERTEYKNPISKSSRFKKILNFIE